jgi:signal transduction histidine kinase/CheY-like chemotaxis protein
MRLFKIKCSGFWSYQPLLSVVLCLIIVTANYQFLNSQKTVLRQKEKIVLENSLNSLESLLTSWSLDQQKIVSAWANQRDNHNTIQQLLRLDSGLSGNVSQSSLVAKLQAQFKPLIEPHNYENFILFSPKGKVIASHYPEPANRNYPFSLEMALANIPQIGHPYKVSILKNKIHNSPDIQMMIVVPIEGENQRNIIGVLALTIDPSHSFAGFFRTIRPGETGDSYAIDSNALMLTNSRFLKEMNLKSTALNLHIQDPSLAQKAQGSRGTETLTFMAKHLTTNSETWFNLDGYQSYRGEEVVGAWIWVDALNMGITVEMGYEEAYHYYHELSIYSWSLLVLLHLLLFVILYLRKSSVIQQELSNKLLISKQNAERANSAKDLFLANMSHEIRTPLNSIIGISDILQDSQLTSEQQGYAKILKKSGRSLLALINDILDISKIEAGEMVITSQVFQPKELLDDITAIMKSRAEQKSIQLKTNLSSGVPELISGDMMHIKQVLLNLVSNAIKFTSRGWVQVDISKDHWGMINFTVTDTGSGIASDKLETIFERFTQDKSQKREIIEGTGLGLAISNQLVALMGGERIFVQSHKDRGSIFSFVLPLSPVNIGAKQLKTIKQSEPSQTLVIKCPSSPISDDLTTLIENSNSKITIVHSAADAFTTLQQKGVDYFNSILVEEQLPDMRCEQFIQQFYLHYDNNRIPISILSSTSNDSAPELSYCHLNNNSNRGGRRILLVDDSDENRLIVRQFLKNQSITLVEVDNGKSGLKQIKESSPFDLVLMDVQMPDMDGLECTKLIRQHEKNMEKHPTPIVMLSANAFSDDVARSIAYGANEHESKPIYKKKLLTIIERYIPILN